MSDFFDERFFKRLKLRKKRCVLQVRANIVAIDETFERLKLPVDHFLRIRRKRTQLIEQEAHFALLTHTGREFRASSTEFSTISADYENRTIVTMPIARASVDLRADRRYMVNVAGALQVEGLATDVYVITVLDISRSDLRVSCPISVPAGSRVTVTACQANIIGEVRYTREVGPNEFWLGIKADKGADGGLDLTPFLQPITRCL